jgi:hypothetical protein
MSSAKSSMSQSGVLNHTGGSHISQSILNQCTVEKIATLISNTITINYSAVSQSRKYQNTGLGPVRSTTHTSSTPRVAWIWPPRRGLGLAYPPLHLSPTPLISWFRAKTCIKL